MPRLYRKTPKGFQEIARRSHRLGTRVRAALILADGQRTEDDICQLLGPQAREWLIELTWQNLVEAVPVDTAAGPDAQRIAASRSQVSTTVSGLSDIEAMPSWASHSAKSG
jgi:hypothetical protein